MSHLFQIVDSFLTFTFYKVKVATHLRLDEIPNDQCVTQSLLSLAVKEF